MQKSFLCLTPTPVNVPDFQLLDALELSQSPLLLRLMAGVLCRDRRHIMEEQFQNSFQKIAKRFIKASLSVLIVSGVALWGRQVSCIMFPCSSSLKERAPTSSCGSCEQLTRWSRRARCLCARCCRPWSEWCCPWPSTAAPRPSASSLCPTYVTLAPCCSGASPRFVSVLQELGSFLCFKLEFL